MNDRRAKEAMERYSVDCLLACSIENVQYVTGFRSFLKQVDPLVQTFGIYTGNAKNDRLVAPYSEADVVSLSDLRVNNVHLYGTFPIVISEQDTNEKEKVLTSLLLRKSSDTVEQALVEALQECGLRGTTIGVDEKAIHQGILDNLKRSMPSTKFVPASDIFRYIRSVKTEQEIKKLRDVVELTEKAIEDSTPLIQGGTTAEIIKRIESTEVQAGARPIFTVVASSPLASFPNAPGTDHIIMKGEPVRYDIGCMLQGYCSDLGRTYTFSKPNEKISRYYQALLKGLEDALQDVRAGVKASHIFSTAVSSVRKNGIPYYERHHVGHGIGLSVYDSPAITMNSNDILEEGMVINVETPFYQLGFTGLIVEDCIIVRKEGYELLSKLPREIEHFSGSV